MCVYACFEPMCDILYVCFFALTSIPCVRFAAVCLVLLSAGWLRYCAYEEHQSRALKEVYTQGKAMRSERAIEHTRLHAHTSIHTLRSRLARHQKRQTNLGPARVRTYTDESASEIESEYFPENENIVKIFDLNNSRVIPRRDLLSINRLFLM